MPRKLRTPKYGHHKATGQARVKATVDNAVVCEGVLKFMLIDSSADEPSELDERGGDTP